MANFFAENYSHENKVTICNEGSSRSSKTWDAFHFIVAYCDHNRDKKKEIYILRNTLVDCRDFTFKEFEKVLNVIGIWDDSKKKESPKPYYNLFGNHIYFRGLDQEKEAPPSDIIFVNESLEIDTRKKLKGWFMRCRVAQILDWNPKYTDHWCFKMEGQPNTLFTHSTYKDNKHLQVSVIKEIESYCPWNFKDLHLPEKERRPHLENIKNTTADRYQWEVYGEGKRSAPEGLIFPYVKYIDKFPDIAHIYCQDFGFTVDPSALVKYAEDAANIYVELLLYKPMETSEELSEYYIEIAITNEDIIIADSSDKYTSETKGAIEMVKDMRNHGWTMRKVSKTKSVIFWLLSMKKKKINIVINELSPFARTEQENYRMKEIHGIKINQPIDKFNHFWDATRYGHMSHNQNNLSW